MRCPIFSHQMCKGARYVRRGTILIFTRVCSFVFLSIKQNLICNVSDRKKLVSKFNVEPNGVFLILGLP